tara:strand:- start:148 stop:405 length:258 start_codon:yes stop_codon:yes gene_type:complete
MYSPRGQKSKRQISDADQAHTRTVRTKSAELPGRRTSDQFQSQGSTATPVPKWQKLCSNGSYKKLWGWDDYGRQARHEGNSIRML